MSYLVTSHLQKALPTTETVLSMSGTNDGMRTQGLGRKCQNRFCHFQRGVSILAVTEPLEKEL